MSYTKISHHFHHPFFIPNAFQSLLPSHQAALINLIFLATPDNFSHVSIPLDSSSEQSDNNVLTVAYLTGKNDSSLLINIKEGF